MCKKNIAILFGGASTEHEVSRKSATAILENINKDKYNIFNIGITKKGQWLLYTGNINKIQSGEWELDPNNTSVYISTTPSTKGIMILKNNKLEIINIDVAIPVLHGKNGEDGTIQGLLTLCNIPYVGCDTTSSAICMDKVITNIILENSKIDQAKYTWIYSYEFKTSQLECIEKIENSLSNYPIFVKPAKAGSSIGITKANNREELIQAIKVASKEDSKILFEEAINGKEVECAILGNDDDLISSIIGEIAPSNEFYDYEAKYESDSLLYIPAHISDDLSNKIRQEAIKAYKVLGCSGLSRVDFFVENKTNRILLNEINTFPGFTSISMYPMLMSKMSIDLPELIDRLINLAIERNGLLNAK